MNSFHDAVIVGAARTPQGRLMGQLASLTAMELGGFAIAAALERAGISASTPSAVIMGQVLQAGSGQNPARQSAVYAGIPLSVPATTINKVCLSGLSAIIDGARLVRLGEADVVVAGGQESMSNAPRLLGGSSSGRSFGELPLRDSISVDGLTDAFDQESMGLATDRAGTALGLLRSDQDEVAALSHVRAAQAQRDGLFDVEIAPVEVATRAGLKGITDDEGIRGDTTAAKLSSLRPAFDPLGSVTAGNASPLNDGAAAVVVASRGYAERHGLDVLATLGPSGQIAGPDTTLLDKPALAISAALEKTAWEIEDLSFIEMNEAFASVSLHSARILNVSMDRVNVNGGAIALGHPIGASGARLVVSAAYELVRRGNGKAAVALCGGGGQGDALLLSR